MLIKRNENISARESMLKIFKKNNVELEIIEPRNGEVINYVEIIDDGGNPIKLYGDPSELLSNYNNYSCTNSNDCKIECEAKLVSIIDDTVNKLLTYELDELSGRYLWANCPVKYNGNAEKNPIAAAA